MLLSNSRFGDYLHLIWSWSKGYYCHSKVFFLPWHSYSNRQWRNIEKTRYVCTFSIVNFRFIRSNIPTTTYGDYILHICVILRFVPSTVIFWVFWTELSCSRKSYWNKVTLLLGWSHHYTNSTSCLTVTKYPFLKWQ